VPTSYEDKDFLTPENIFRRYSDEVLASSLQLQSKIPLFKKHYLIGVLEAVISQEKRNGFDRNFFAKLGAGYCPRRRDAECAEFYFSNKALLGLNPNTAPRSIEESLGGGLRLFDNHWYFGADVAFTY